MITLYHYTLHYVSQSNNMSDCVPVHERLKYFDDLTVLELVKLLNIRLSSQNVKPSVPSNLPSHNQFVPNVHLKTQEYLNKISDSVTFVSMYDIV